MKKAIALVALAALLCGCAGEKNTELVPVNKTLACSRPYILHEGSCCLDLDGNGVCDASEGSPTSLSAATPTTEPQKSGATSTTVKQTCTDGIQNQDETGTDCGGVCKPCLTLCERLVYDTAVKPAARTVKLCLTDSVPVSYAGYEYTTADMDGTRTIYAIDANGSVTRNPAAKKDVYFGNVVMRVIGTAEERGKPYTFVYAWTIQGDVKCHTNSDCGEDTFAGYECSGGQKIMRKYLHYYCTQPGTILSGCQAIERQEDYLLCDSSENCAKGFEKCFPKECFNNASDKDEIGTDCGGSCKPCFCGNGLRDGDEEGTDCGGSCSKCEGAIETEKVPPALSIRSPQSRVYDSRSVELSFDVNEPVSWCGYSLNGGPMLTLRGNGSLYARPGLNELVLYCNDSSGNVNHTSRTFNVTLIENRICREDRMPSLYDGSFDNATFYLATEDYLGFPDRCTGAEYSYSLTALADADRHARTLDGSMQMRDANLTAQKGASLSYECRTTGRLKAGYVKLQAGKDPTALPALRLLLYFRESGLENDPGAFWRIHSYRRDGPNAAEDRFVDVPYRPVSSACANASFQEIDLGPLLPVMETADLEMRMGFYTSKLNVEINLLEARYDAEKRG